MGTVFGSNPPVSDVANALIDIEWEAQGYHEPTSEAVFIANGISRGTRYPPQNFNGTSALSVITGGAATIVRDATTGIQYVSVTSGGGTRTTRTGATLYAIPCGAQFGGNIPSFRRLRRYRAGALIRVPVRGTAILEFGLVLSNGYLTFLGTDPAFVLSSDPGVNGGQWTPRVRQIQAGGITTLASIGVLPNAASFDLIEVQYTEGPVPLLEILRNGVTVATRSGLGVVPTTNTATNFHFGFGCSAIAGTTIEYAGFRYRIEEL